MNPLVFMSHASEDAAEARLLCSFVEQSGIDCWIAPRNVTAGQRYGEAITEAIEGCAVFVLVFSEVTRHSPHVRNELERAASLDKTVMVVRTDDASPGDDPEIGYFVTNRHWYDASDGGVEVHGEHIASAVAAALRRTGAVPEKPVVTVSKDEPAPATLSIGIDVGEDELRACVVDLADPAREYPPLNTWVVPLPHPNARAALENTKDLLTRILGEHFTTNEPVGVGLALPGQVDARAGVLKFGAHLFGARNVPFKTALSKEFPSLRVRVDNEVRCLTRCELHAGMGRDYDTFVCLLVASGVGSGTVIDRKVYFGENYCAGEVGHIKISSTGPPCACGQVGCLETFVNAGAIVALAEGKAVDWRGRGLTSLLSEGEPLDIPQIAEALDEGDPAAQEAIREIAAALGRGIANYLNLVNPSAVSIGGWVMNSLFLHMSDEVAASLQKNALAEVANTPIIQSGYGDDGISRGAAFLFHPDDHWPFSSGRTS